MTLDVTIFTLHPEIYPGPLGVSLMGRGLGEGKWSLKVVNIRDYASDRYRTVDDDPYGGGAGMVLRPDVLDRALRAHYVCNPDEKPVYSGKLLYLSPRGPTFAQKTAKRLANEEALGVVCGRFEGLDQRVIDLWQMDEVSLGDFVLAGGDVAAMAMLEATVRLLPGVLGSADSLVEESFQQDLLEYPLYTRPRSWAGLSVPDVLVSGHHEQIRTWRRQQSELLTQARRPDLWKRYNESAKEGEENERN